MAIPAVTGVTAAKEVEGDGSEPPLHVAAQSNRVEDVRSLVANRADVNAQNKSFGWTAMHVAAGDGACGAIEALLELRGDVGAAAKDGEAPLHLAGAEGQGQSIRLLVAARADVNHANADGETPLHVAIQHVGAKPGLNHIRTLLELRADASLQDKSGHDAFATAGVFTNRGDEIKSILGGSAPKKCSPEDPWPDTPAELTDGTEPIVVAESLREHGNKSFREGLYDQAAKCYMKAKLFLPTGPAAHAPVVDGDEAGARARACFIAVSSNAAMCKLKLGELDVCIRMCDGVLALDPNNVKALYRKGLALRSQEADDDAEIVLKEAARLEPGDKAVQKELTDIARRRREDKDKAKRLAQKMFG
eukprot:TRINITY_DN43401_c0_g1_i1.p1 TRINITY_DN43401_c0_g1~~TRINITY_DN43401_c0_g1_i1.p1  ORF type:complete len:362 (-),score=75.06 TRINITY_DN43401_c0_g1_i1:121-1206(-)